MRFGSERKSLKVIAREFDISLSRVSQIVNESIKRVQLYSIEEKPDATGFNDLCNMIFDSCTDHNISIFHVINALDSVPDQKAAMVVKLRYGLFGGKRLTLQEVADIFGVTAMRISQLEDTGIKSLKHRSRKRFFSV